MRQQHRTPLPLCLTAGLALVAAPACYPALRLAPDDSHEVLAHHTLDAPNPAAPGGFEVRRLYYGSGTDRRRPEYRDSVAIRTDSVDASKFVDLGATAASRNRYWGFTPKGMPRNARVWYPEGAGPFPLVLIVHGNHDMTDFSDPGYAYLGELLASRGYIMASIDMNFLNGGIRGENDARGWMLLKHLEAWRGFHEAESGPFAGRVDMSRIALIGHSRGGEAVAHAAAFNRLSHYPDDARVSFDFGFDIRSLIAIAPVDGQYQPADRLVPLEDVSYLVFHGSHDGDVSTFAGLRAWQRLQFTDDVPRLKAAVYMYRANHGQWNTGWGAHDNGPRSGRILDLRPLIDGDEQREFAKVYISAFLDATLREGTAYLPLFRDHRVAADWLPRTMYITRFQHSSFRPIASYEEDIDVTTGSVSGVRIRGDSLATWREGEVRMRWANSTFLNKAVWLGWNNRLAGADTTRMGPPAVYALTLPDTLARAWRLHEGATLDLLLMPTDAMPPPRPAPVDTTAAPDSAAAPAAARPPRAPRPDPDAPKPPVDLTIEVVDAAGVAARVPLSRYGAIRRPLETRVLRRGDREASAFAQLHELVLQSFTIPLADFVAAAPALDLARLAEVRLVFDRAVAGTVIVDDIGFSRPDAAWLEAPAISAGAARGGASARRPAPATRSPARAGRP
jgi:dienelactone hydrolase